MKLPGIQHRLGLCNWGFGGVAKNKEPTHLTYVSF